MKKLLLRFACALTLSATCAAVQTQTLGDHHGADFSAGKTDNVYVDGRGRVVLAVEEIELLSDVDHAWCVAVGAGGDVYVGTVPGGKVYRAGGGKAEVLFESGEAGVFSIAVLPDGDVVLGTGSEGKVYRVKPTGESELVADFAEPYVFALAVEPGGAILAATGGDAGNVYRLAKGEVELVYESPGKHLMALALGTDGKIYAGSGDRGAVYEIDPSGGARVLYAAKEGVIGALAIDGDGVVYAGTAAIAEPKPGAEAKAVRSIAGELSARQIRNSAPEGKPTVPAKREYKVTNAVYAIEPAGTVRRIFSLKGALVMSLLVEGDTVLAATAGKAGIYRFPADGGPSALVHKTESEEVHALAQHPKGGFAAGFGMPGKAVHFSPRRQPKGTFTSRAFAAKGLSRWGRASWLAETPTGTALGFSMRSGNSPEPDVTWTDWKPLKSEGAGAATALPPSRYVQYRAELKSAAPEATPALERFEIAALAVNLPPRITQILAGKAPAKPAGNSGKSSKPKAGNPGSGALSRMVSLSWKASDPNGDKLEYRLEFRDEGMKSFIELAEKLGKSQFKWDTTTVPDGQYRFRVTASDAPGNPAGTELTFSKTEGPFTVDNTPPVLTGPDVTTNGVVKVTVKAEDSASTLKAALFSVDGGKWQPVHPVDGIFDSKSETISVTVTDEDAVVVMIRVVDRAGNSSALRALLGEGK